MNLKLLYLSLLGVCVIFVGLASVYYDTAQEYNKIGVTTQELTISNESLNRLSDLTSASNSLANQWINRTQMGILDYVAAVFKDGFSAIQNFFDLIFVLPGEILHQISAVFGVPEWMTGAAIAAITVTLVLSIIGLVIGQEQ